MKPEMIILVDENDSIIGHVPRGDLSATTIHRVSALWVTNSRGYILLAQRHREKENDPGKWGPAVAGTNEQGETYEWNILKEAEEEIGLTGIEFQKAMKLERFDARHPHFCQWFTCIIDRGIDQFRLQESEVQDLRWWSKTELRKALTETPEIFLASLPRYFEMFEGERFKDWKTP
jgi:isopentenyldiphosphate isomerase